MMVDYIFEIEGLAGWWHRLQPVFRKPGENPVYGPLLSKCYRRNLPHWHPPGAAVFVEQAVRVSRIDSECLMTQCFAA